MKYLNSKQQKERFVIIGELDLLFKALYSKIKEKKVSDKVFSNLPETKNLTDSILEKIKKLGVKPNYENLTNYNYHILVKVVNYQNYFKKLPKEVKDALKKRDLIS